MPKRKSPKKTRQTQAVIVVLIPQLPMQRIDDDVAYYNGAVEELPASSLKPGDMTEDSLEILSQAVATRKRLNKLYNKTGDPRVVQHIVYLGDSDPTSRHSILHYLDSLREEDSAVVVCGHGNPKTIGSIGGQGIGPEMLADLFFYQLSLEQIAYLNKIELQTCNSGWSPDYSEEVVLNESYVGKFSKAMMVRGASDLTVVGYCGFLHEEKGRSHAYVAPRLGFDKGKRRSEEQQVIIRTREGAIMEITLPQKPFEVVFEGTAFNPELLFEYLQKRFSRASESASATILEEEVPTSPAEGVSAAAAAAVAVATPSLSAAQSATNPSLAELGLFSLPNPPPSDTSPTYLKSERTPPS